MKYADIIIDISHEKLDRSFQYRVPKALEQEIKVGMVAAIPFGNGNHIRKGYVIGFSDTPKFDPEKIKEIQSLCSSEETTESRLIALAEWMREHYGSTMIQALKTVLPIRRKIKAKEQKYLCLNLPKEEAGELLEKLEGSRYKARERLLRVLLERGRIPFTEASREFGTTGAVVSRMEEQGILRVEYEQEYRSPIAGEIPQEQEVPLTTEQQAAVDGIVQEWESSHPRTALIEGVTGSGKTQVYMKLIEHVLKQGRQAIVLIPEIALTYQTVRRFYGRFGNRVSVINSRMSQGERYDQFKRARKGEVQVMVGPRSALFTPFQKLGLIVVDEEHESSYKSENSPRYHARETAIQRASMEGAHVVLGSATPSLEAYSRALSGEYVLMRLTARYGERPLPQVSVVDLREELKAGNRSVLSRSLREAMESRLAGGEQVILFLNRRGYAGFVACRACGHVVKCPHCDVSLSEHNDGRLHCHYCGHSEERPSVCPVCGSPYIGGFKAGTQQIEKVVRDTFPGVRTLRMDYDTTRSKGSYEEILQAFAAHKADVLIGTQMIVKGHDFPEVTLVGVIAADLSLNAADYQCAERTFQLLCQAVGRCGRGEKPGEAILQTYHPEHYSIQAAAVQDYAAFYQEEMSYRMMMDYPPASHMTAVLGSCADEELLEKAMHYLELYIRRLSRPDGSLHIIGPANASVGKVKDIYRKVIYLKHEDYSVLVKIKDRLERYIEINSGFRNVYIQFDFN